MTRFIVDIFRALFDALLDLLAYVAATWGDIEEGRMLRNLSAEMARRELVGVPWN